jgi:diguanylate cyclase (GGDEF)-like protein
MVASDGQPVRSRRLWRWTVLTVVLYAAYGAAMVVTHLAMKAEEPPVDEVAGPAIALFSLVGLGFAIRAAAHRGLDRRTRWAWGIASVSFALLLATPVLFITLGESRFPAPGDLARLAFVLVLLMALQAFPLRSTSRQARYKVALDAATVVVGGSMVLWYLVIGPAVRDGAPIGLVTALAAYPVADLALIFGIAIILLRGADRSARGPLTLVGAAMLFFVVGDVYVSYVRVHSLPVAKADWQFVCWLTAHFLLAAAALEQCRLAGRHDLDADAGRRIRSATKLPYLAVGLGYALMLVAAVREAQVYPWSGLVLGGVAITAIVVLRQVVVQRESHQMAVTDGLTGLASRSRLHDGLNRALARGLRNGQKTGVLVADLNGFKQVNDSLGHKAGDLLLVAFGALMSRSVLGSDLVGRLGGDEFAVVLHDIGGPSNAEVVARRIVAAMAQPIVIGGVPVAPRASIGIALSEPGEIGVDELLHRADVAMYSAKRRRTNAWACYDDTMDDLGGMSLEDDLRRAVAAGQMRLVYQPIVALPGGELTGVEALVRWEHPKRGLLGPQSFIALAERVDVIGELGGWVLEQACLRVRQWQLRLGESRTLRLNVNVSPRQLDDDNFSASVLATLKSTGFDPRDLVLELTESAMVGEDLPVAHLETLNAEGIRIALDDFGTGYSSLRYLTRLPVGVLKLDRCFVAQLDGTPRGSAVAEAVIRLGRILHLDTVAEGVEHAAQARELTLLGCNTAQGYHFARPMTGPALDAVIDDWSGPKPAPPADPGASLWSASTPTFGL